MITAGGRCDNTWAMPEYQISRYQGKQSNLFEAKTPRSDWNKEKSNNFIDFYTRSKAFVPSPDQYRNKHEISISTEKVVSPTLYKAPRKT